jgi:hypothetical protein
VSQKWGPTKTFWANLWKCCFLLVCLGCYVNDVCLSCLLNTFMNQHNPCALVIMLLFMLLAIFQNHYLGKLSFSIQIILFIQISAKIYFWDKAFIKTKYLQNYLDLQSRVVPLFLQTFILLIFIKGFQTPLRRLYKGDVYVSICFQNYLPKPYSFIWKPFSTWPWHDHWALVQSLFLIMLD